MDDIDRRMFALFALFAGAIGTGILAGLAAQWTTGSTGVGVGVMFVVIALVFGIAAVDPEEN